MLSVNTLRMYSFIIYTTTCLKLIPFKWNSKTLKLTKCTRIGFCAWCCIIILQSAHFIFLMWRLIESINIGLKPSLIMFQSVWNVLFSIPVFLHLSTALTLQGIPILVSEWLRLEMAMPTKTNNAIRVFIMLYIPIAGVQIWTHGFMFKENPKRPQYLYSVWAMIHEGSEDHVWIFGLIEFGLANLNWAICFFYLFFLLGAGCSLNSWIKVTSTTMDSRDAFILYKQTRKYTIALNDLLNFALRAQKLILFFCFIFLIYNTLKADDLPILPYLMMPLTAFATFVAFVLVYTPLCFLSRNSIECLRVWRSKSNTTLQKKLWFSQPSIGIKAGPFYILEHKTVFTFLDLTISYVITALLVY